MIYTHRNTLQQHTAKEYYTHHNNMLVRNGLAAVIYDKSLNYGKFCTCITFTRGHNHTARI